MDSLQDSGDDTLARRPGPDGSLQADVCIVGGGLTGLWTAYELTERDPSLHIVVLERDFAGFGASGRNGGWCSALFPKSASALERSYGFDAAVAMRAAMTETVAEVGRVVEREGIDCDYVRGGTVLFARDAVQWQDAKDEVAESARFGVDESELWSADRVRSEFGVSGIDGPVHGAVFEPHCARVHPAKLVRGLARVVEQRGVRIFEGTAVTDFAPTVVRWEHRSRDENGEHGVLRAGTVRARSVIVATEGYGAQLRGVGRRILPLYSLMIATEPLDDEVWERIGIRHGQTFSDYRNLLIYGQRTADNRFAFGGRGARYHFGSTIRAEYDRVERVFEHLRHTLAELFPDAAGARITHSWGGPLGVARDWHASVSYNPKTGVGFAGGYVGDGLSTTNLAGRTLADLVTGRSSELTRLPWVNHLSPKWEPEPLRFIGANLGLVATDWADREQAVTGKASMIAKLTAPLTGH